MAGMQLYKDQLPIMYPHMFAALQKLVMAMESVAKNVGKKTFFGKDKGAEAYIKFVDCLRQTVVASILDGKSSESSSNEHVIGVITMVLGKFELAYPNWPLAYEFSAHFFSDGNRQNSLALLQRIRS
jgi:hypothetical protein